MEVRECNDDLHFVRSPIVVSSPPTVELETSGSEAVMILYVRVRQQAETCENHVPEVCYISEKEGIFRWIRSTGVKEDVCISMSLAANSIKFGRKGGW